MADARKAVLDWLELKIFGPRLIANVSDQVPPEAEKRRIEIMRDMAEEFGRY